MSRSGPADRRSPTLVVTTHDETSSSPRSQEADSPPDTPTPGSSGDEALNVLRHSIIVNGKSCSFAELLNRTSASLPELPLCSPPSPSPSPEQSARLSKRLSSSVGRFLSRGSESAPTTPSSSSRQVSTRRKTSKNAAPRLWLPLVDFLCRFVELRGLSVVGIFRLSGSARTVAELVVACRKLIAKKGAGEEDMQKLFKPHQADVHTMASVIKTYLREQSEPLLPFAFYQAFMQAAGITDESEKVAQLRHLVSQLPDECRNILCRLVHMLAAVAANSEQNKMDAANLAIVFGPSMLKAGDGDGDDLNILLQVRTQCLVIENCIVFHEQIFGNKPSENSPSSRSILSSSEQESLSIEQLAVEVKEAEKESRDFDAIVEELQSKEADEEPTATEQQQQCQQHVFKKESFSRATCRHCAKSIYGLRKVYRCELCDFTCHRKCRESVAKACPGSRTTEPGDKH